MQDCISNKQTSGLQYPPQTDQWAFKYSQKTQKKRWSYLKASSPTRRLWLQLTAPFFWFSPSQLASLVFHLFPNIFPPQSLPAILLERWTSALKCLCKNQSLRIPSQKMTVKTSPFPMENLPTKNSKQFPSSFLLQLKKNPPCNF